MKQIVSGSTAAADDLEFLMVDSTDHVTGKTGLTVTVTIRKPGGSFASPSGAVSEIANGWYRVAANATDNNTTGALLLHATATGADPSDVSYQVVSDSPYVAKPTNFASLSIDGSGRVDVIKINGTSQTARDIGASVLISSGSGAGQLDVTSGVIKANLAQILGTALTETAGQIAAAFKKWFDVATPTGTVNSIPNATAGAAGGLFIAGTNAATTITTSLTTTFTGNLTGSVASVTGAVGSVTGDVGGNVTGSVGSLAAQAKTDVKTQAVAALNTDTYAEPGQGTPAATTTLVAKIGYLYKAWRNRNTQTATQYSLYNDDAVTVDQKATVSDDSTTFDRTEIATGP